MVPGYYNRYRVSHETWQLVNSFECLLPYSLLFDTKDNNTNTFWESCYSKIGYKVKYVSEKHLFNEINFKKPSISIKYIKDDLYNYLLSCFVGHPVSRCLSSKKNWAFIATRNCTNQYKTEWKCLCLILRFCYIWYISENVRSTF